MKFDDLFEAINVLTDDLLTAIAKAGGLNTQEAIAQGIDPEDIKTAYALGIKRVFTKTGRSFDAMAEYLSQLGYPVTDEKGHYSGNELLDVLDDALRGKRINSTHGGEADFERRYAAMAHQYEHKRPLESILTETVFKVGRSKNGEELVVYKNPSNLELKRIIKPGKNIGVPFIILENGDCLFWTDRASFHADIYKHFDEWGIDDMDSLPCRGVIEGRDLEVYSTDLFSIVPFKNLSAGEREQFVLNNKYLKEHFRIEVHFDDEENFDSLDENIEPNGGWQVANGGTYYNELEDGDDDETGEDAEVSESVFQTVLNHLDNPLTVYINPSSIELKKIIKGTGDLYQGYDNNPIIPFIILSDGRCLFWFPHALHYEIYKHFAEWAIPEKGFIPCYACLDGRELHVEVTDSIHNNHPKDASVKAKILSNKYLNDNFHLDTDVGYYDEAIGGKWEDLKETTIGSALIHEQMTTFYWNPSNLELKNIIKINGENSIPFILFGNGKVLFWTPRSILHWFVVQKFGRIGIDDTHDFIPCRMGLKGRDAHIHITETLSETDYAAKIKQAIDIIRTNKYLKETFHISRIESEIDDAPIYTAGDEQYNETALMEAYDFMATFNPILNLPSLPPGDKKYLTDQISKDIREAKTELKRQDRITWYLRFIKYKYAALLEKSATLKSVRHKDEPDRKLAETDKNKLREIIAKLKSQNVNSTSTNELLFSTAYMLEQLKHYLSLPIASIQNYTFTDQNFTDITAVFSEAEKAWAETRVGAVAHSDLDVFLQLPDDYAWYDLKTAGSREEADAMGHCGNMPCSSDPDQTILSLRHTETLDEKKVFRISLTFVLHKSTGMLGEMKGRANTKPAQKYHQYIIPLLEDPRIKGIAGGTWMVKENFTVFDLPEAEVKRLLLEKPALAPLGEYIEHYGLDSYVMGKVAFIFKPISASHIEFHGEKFKYMMWNNVHMFSRTQEGNHQFVWMYNHISGDDPIDTSNDWAPDADALEGMFNKENEKKFLADAKKAWGKEIADENKDGDEDKDEIDIDNLKSVLEYMEEHQEDAYQEILNSYYNANDGATSDAIYKSFMDDLKNGEIDTEEVLANVINVDGSTDQAKLENVRIELDGIENMDDPVWVIFDLAEFLKDVAASEPNFNQIDDITAYMGDLHMNEPRNGYEPNYRNLIEIFNTTLDEMWGEIFK